jgi:hypothetical protein
MGGKCIFPQAVKRAPQKAFDRPVRYLEAK